MIYPPGYRTVSKVVTGLRGPGRFVTLKVLMYMQTCVDEETFELASREALAELAGSTPANVSKALARLVSYGALVEVRDGRRKRYFGNPLVGWGSIDWNEEQARAVGYMLTQLGRPDADWEGRTESALSIEDLQIFGRFLRQGKLTLPRPRPSLRVIAGGVAEHA